MNSLFKIGEVSKLCDISIKTLRYYEEFGLIKPVEVDKYTGYRYYDKCNIEIIYKIQFLKELGFSLQEIKDFDDSSIDKISEKLKKFKNEIQNKLDIISSIKNIKGEFVMKPFINDIDAIGKWQYVCSSVSRENYAKNDVYTDSVLFKELYFLPNGEGYWVFDRWTKGIIYYFKGVQYNYVIENDKLFLEVYNEDNEYELLMVYTKVDSKEYKKEDIARKDNIDMPFVNDEKAIGVWESCDFISFKDKYDYKPRKKTDKKLFVSRLNIMSNGEFYEEYSDGAIIKNTWTKNHLISKKASLDTHYILQSIDGVDYLIMDWKSGDYIYGGEIQGCYVFKKVE